MIKLLIECLCFVEDKLDNIEKIIDNHRKSLEIQKLNCQCLAKNCYYWSDGCQQEKISIGKNTKCLDFKER